MLREVKDSLKDKTGITKAIPIIRSTIDEEVNSCSGNVDIYIYCYELNKAKQYPESPCHENELLIEIMEDGSFEYKWTKTTKLKQARDVIHKLKRFGGIVFDFVSGAVSYMGNVMHSITYPDRDHK